MRVAHSAQAVLKARLVNHRVFTRKAEAEGLNEDLLGGDEGCDEPVPFDDNCWEIWESS
jgi:hypothetical protein